MDSEHSWPPELLRGVLDLAVLCVVEEGPTYGYAIATALADRGLGSIKGGTLYPLLKRFEDAAWVTVDWRPGDGGPGRKYYSLTAVGKAALAERAATWNAFVPVVTSFVARRLTSTEVLP